MLCDRQFSDPITPVFLMPDFALARYSRSRSDCFRCPDTESDDTPQCHSQSHRDRALHANLINPAPTAHEAPSGVASSRLRHTLSTLISFFQGDIQVNFWLFGWAASP
jgi:hypothetical protein